MCSPLTWPCIYPEGLGREVTGHVQSRGGANLWRGGQFRPDYAGEGLPEVGGEQLLKPLERMKQESDETRNETWMKQATFRGWTDKPNFIN